MLMSNVEFHVLCVKVGLDLGCHVVIGVVLGFTAQTQYQVKSSFLLDFEVHLCTCSQTVFCDRQFICCQIIAHFSIAKTGHLRWSLHSGISELARPESANNGSSRSLLGSFLLDFGFLLAWSISGSPDRSWTVVDTVTGEMSLSVRSSRSRSRVLISLTVGDEDEVEEEVEQWLSCFKSVLEVDESDPEDEFDKPGTTIGTKFSVFQGIRIPFLMRCGFWPVVHSWEYPFSSQSIPSDTTAGVFSRTFIVKNISNSLTYTVCLLMRLHFTIAGYDYRRTARFRQSIHFSITQVLFCWSYASTRRSRQQILVPQVQELMQASTYFPKVRRMLLFLAPLILIHFWPASTLLRGHLALATLSPPETDPQILERWGCADEVHLGKKIRAKDFGLEF